MIHLYFVIYKTVLTDGKEKKKCSLTPDGLRNTGLYISDSCLDSLLKFKCCFVTISGVKKYKLKQLPEF